MWLSEIRVRNFRLFRGETKIKLTKGLNVIHSDDPDYSWISNFVEFTKAALGYYVADQQRSVLATLFSDDSYFKIDWHDEKPNCLVEVDVAEGDVIYRCGFSADINENGKHRIRSFVPEYVTAKIGKVSVGEIFLDRDELSFIGVIEDENASDPQYLNLRRFLVNAKRRGCSFAVVVDPQFVFYGRSRYLPLEESRLEQILFITDNYSEMEDLQVKTQNVVRLETYDQSSSV